MENYRTQNLPKQTYCESQNYVSECNEDIQQGSPVISIKQRYRTPLKPIKENSQENLTQVTRQSYQSSNYQESNVFRTKKRNLFKTPTSSKYLNYSQTNESNIAFESPYKSTFKEKKPQLISIRELEPKIRCQNIRDGERRVVREERQQPQFKSSVRTSIRRDTTPEIERIKKEKIIEVLKEIAVPVEKFVDVKYDVVVDVPIERIIEKEIITEVTVERPIEKIVEIPVEQIIEVPVEKIIEVPVENKIFKEKQIEKIIKKPYDVIRENIIRKDRIIDIRESELQFYQDGSFEIMPTKINYEKRDKIVEKPIYIENIIEKQKRVDVPKYIEIAKEKIIEKKIPHYIERKIPIEKRIEKIVEVPKEVAVYKEIEVLVEKPIYIENIIEKKIPKINYIEKDVEVPVEKIVERPIYVDNIIEKKVDKIIEVPVYNEKLIEVPIDKYTENHIEVEKIKPVISEKQLIKQKPYITQQEIEIEYQIPKFIEERVEYPINKVVNVYDEKFIEQEIHKPCYIEVIKEIPIEIEKDIEIPMEHTIQNIQLVDKIIEKEVYYDTIIEKKVEVIIEKEVQVPVEKIIEVPITIYQEVPVYREKIIEEEVLVEQDVNEYFEEECNQEHQDYYQDEELDQEIQERERELQYQKEQNQELLQEHQLMIEELDQLQSGFTLNQESENIQLLKKLGELHCLFENELKYSEFLTRKKKRFINLQLEQFQIDPKVKQLREVMEDLIDENEQICEQIKIKSDKIKQSLNINQFNKSMVKAYLNYEHHQTFSATITNIIQPKTITINNNLFFIVASNELVNIISEKSGQIYQTIQPIENNRLSQVTAFDIAQQLLIIGYSNGQIQVYDIFNEEYKQTFSKHENSINHITYFKNKYLNCIISTSINKQAFVWDLDINDTLYELNTLSSPISCILILNKILIVAGKDGNVRIYDKDTGSLIQIIQTGKNEINFMINYQYEFNKGIIKQAIMMSMGDDEFLIYKLSEQEKLEDEFILKKRSSYQKILQIDLYENTLYCLLENQQIETHQILSFKEMKQKHKRKVKRQIKDLQIFEDYQNDPTNFISDEKSLKLQDQFKRFCIYKLNNKIKLFLTNFKNQFCIYQQNEQNDLNQIFQNNLQGHNNAINWLQISHDDYYLISASQECICLWQSDTGKLLKKINITNTTNGIILENNNNCIFTTDKSEVILFSLKTSEILDTINMDQDQQKNVEILKVIKKPNLDSKTLQFLTIGSNQKVSKFTLIVKNKKFKLKLKEQFSLPDLPQNIQYFHSNDKFMVSLLDHSIRQFHGDTNKEYLTYYGHTLQVTDFAIATDDYLMASVSADKSIRIWDTDFGNCRRIINKAHDKGIYKIVILRDTHYALTSGKDNYIKFWDLDTFELIMRFETEMGESIKALIAGRIGDIFFFGGVNKIIRSYQQTKEQVFAIEMKEQLQEEQILEEIEDRKDFQAKDLLLKKQQNLKTAEELMDMIEQINKESRIKQETFENEFFIGKKRTKLPQFPELQNMNPADYVMKKIDRIQRSKLDLILAFIHFDTASKLFYYILYSVENFQYIDLSNYLMRYLVEKYLINIQNNDIILKLVRKIMKKIIYLQQLEEDQCYYIDSALTLYTKEANFLN